MALSITSKKKILSSLWCHIPQNRSENENPRTEQNRTAFSLQ